MAWRMQGSEGLLRTKTPDPNIHLLVRTQVPYDAVTRLQGMGRGGGCDGLSQYGPLKTRDARLWREAQSTARTSVGLNEGAPPGRGEHVTSWPTRTGAMDETMGQGQGHRIIMDARGNGACTTEPDASQWTY